MSNRIAAPLALSALVIFASVFVMFASATPAQALQQRAPRQKMGAQEAAVLYACPMHPDVTSRSPGKCPKCGMALRAGSANSKRSAVAVKTTMRKTETGNSRLQIPDTIVYDQNGKKLNFYTDLVKGRTVAINFIFTTCTTICPPMTATFRKVQRELGGRLGSDIALISVSVDPVTDVPERLKSFAAKFNAGPGWSFVTGSKPEIDQLLTALGASSPDKSDHTSMILIGNDTAGYWTRAYGLAPAATIAKAVNEAAGKSDTTSDASSAVVQVPMSGGKEASAFAERQIERTPGVSSPPSNSNTSESKNSLAKTAATYFPNTVLLTQDNKEVHFYDDLLKDKVALINFVFTTCRGTCSPMTANLAKVQKYLGEQVGQEIVMISISVDSQTDTPEVLKRYANGFKAKPGWYFLTGKKKNVDEVLAKLGGYVEDKQQHSLVLIIGNEATGEWMKVSAMANPTEIANAVTKMLTSKKE